MYLVVTVCAGKSVSEGPDKLSKYWRDAKPMITTRFFKKISIISEFTLPPMTWKAKSATTHWERLCLARIIVSPLGHWPVTQVFPGRDPRNSSWTTCVLLCPQILNNLRIIDNSLSIPGPEWSPFICISNIYTWCVQISYHLKIHKDCWGNIRTSPGIICTGLWNINTGSEKYCALLITPRIYSSLSVLFPNYVY